MKALVTGGTSGIGYGLASHLINAGWDVQIVGRDAQRGQSAAVALGAEFIQADLSLMSDVVRVACQIDDPLDALVLCAGGVSLDSAIHRTAEGYEATFATNYLGKFVLSQSLLPRMAQNGCIVMVGGNGQHKGVSTDWKTAQSGLNAARMAALAVDLYAAQLAQDEPQLRIHTCYPGVVRTNLLQQAPWMMRLYIRLLGTSIEQGSMHLANLITQPHSGVHWDQSAPMRFAPALPSDADPLISYSLSILKAYTSPKEIQHAL